MLWPIGHGQSGVSQAFAPDDAMSVNESGADGGSMLVRMFVATLALLALLGCAASAGRVGVLSGGKPRSYKLVAAPGDDGAPRPLVIALHGWLGTPEQMASMSGLSSAAAQRGFAVIYPEGDWRSWGIDPSSPRGATDVAFLADVVADVAARIPVDPARITAVGFSNGGFMAQALACSGRVRLAGVAVIASGLAASAAASCRPGVAVPFLLIEGTDDPVVPANGTGTGEGRILPANETLAFWATGNRCNGFDLAQAESKEPGVTILRAIGRQCRGGDTEAWFVQGAGHGWPGRDVGYPEFLVGRRTSAIDATSVVVEFLLRQVIASPPPRIGSQ
jgi:polyhydroxybutyrate depolymerase